MKKIFFCAFLCTGIFFSSCKKTEVHPVQADSKSETPTVRVDKDFPNGILVFSSSNGIRDFWNKVHEDRYYANKTVGNFRTLQNSFDDFKAKNNSNISVNGKKLNFVDGPVGLEEFMYDENNTTLPDPSLAGILNPDMQVVVDNTLYQLTRIGIFKVELDHLQDFVGLVTTYQGSITYDPGFVAIPNETPLGNDEYLIGPGMIRQNGLIDIFRPLTYLEDNGGYGGGGTGAPGNGVPDYYTNTTIADAHSFDKEVAIPFVDWAKRRFVFKAQTTDISLFGFGYHQIDIKAKVQREKKILWITYWGESFADEIIVGCDNMSLETDYIFPHPSYFNTMAQPTFEGLADFHIGNAVLKGLNLRVNMPILGQHLTNTELAAFADGTFNTVVGNNYNNIFKLIENKVLNAIDPTYISRYEAYTKRINSVKDDNRLKWTIGKAERPEGYSHTNTWWFDYNIGFSYTEGGGTGGYPLQYNYEYDMKGGSFFGRARVGNVWHGIRIVKL